MKMGLVVSSGLKSFRKKRLLTGGLLVRVQPEEPNLNRFSELQPFAFLVREGTVDPHETIINEGADPGAT